MKIDQLTYFLETAKTQHIGKASKAMNISSSAISHSISTLEEELGVKLFEKQGKYIFLTPFGKKFAEKAEPILLQLGNLKAEMQSDDIKPSGHYKVGASHGLANHWVSRALYGFQKNNPDVHFELLSLRSAQIVEQVSSGELDIGICFSPTESPKLQAIKIKIEPLCIAVSSKNPILKLSLKKQITELSQLNALSPKAFQGIEVCEDHPALRKEKIIVNTKIIYDSYDVAAEIIAMSSYWGLLPKIICERYGLKIISPDGFKAEASITAVIPKHRPLNRFMQSWVNSLKQTF